MARVSTICHEGQLATMSEELSVAATFRECVVETDD